MQLVECNNTNNNSTIQTKIILWKAIRISFFILNRSSNWWVSVVSSFDVVPSHQFALRVLTFMLVPFVSCSSLDRRLCWCVYLCLLSFLFGKIFLEQSLPFERLRAKYHGRNNGTWTGFLSIIDCACGWRQVDEWFILSEAMNGRRIRCSRRTWRQIHGSRRISLPSHYSASLITRMINLFWNDELWSLFREAVFLCQNILMANEKWQNLNRLGCLAFTFNGNIVTLAKPYSG